MPALSYGTIVVDAQGRVLLRAPTGQFGGAAWTFAKGRADKGETPEEAAIRETLEETGHKVKLISPVPGDFAGTTTITRYWMAESVEDTGKHQDETAELRWVSFDDAKKLIATSSPVVAGRDLKVLEAAKIEWDKILEARKRNMIPPAVQGAFNGTLASLAKIAPQHKAQILELSKRLIGELEAKMMKLAGSPEKYATTLTASKLLQLHTVAERLGAEFGNNLGSTLQSVGGDAAAIGREGLVNQINAWAASVPGATDRVVQADLASDLLDPGLLERYEVSRRTYGMEAIAAMRTEMAAGALNGESLSVTWKRVAARVQIPEWRAERIVRTEHSFAVNRRQLEDMRELYGSEPDPKTGVVIVEGWWKQLAATLDNRTGEDSRFVNHQRRRLHKPFKDNKEREYQHPPNRPNDREVVLFVPDKAMPKVKKAAAEPLPDPNKAPAWPADPTKLKVVSRLGGSTGAELVEDERGQRFVRKQPGPRLKADHIRSEAMADGIYRAAGVSVPDGRLYETPAGPVKLTRHLPGTVELGKLSVDARRAADHELRKAFAVDAAMGNWDVIGQGYDNVLASPDGKTIYRIDNGGSLGYRAQGARKTATEWAAEPHDLWSMRDPASAAQAAKVFGGLDWDLIAEQMRELKSKASGIQAVIDEAVKASPSPGELKTDGALLMKRIATMGELADVSRAMRTDRFKSAYVDGFARHKMGLRSVLSLPTKLKNAANKSTMIGGAKVEYSDVSLVDENGKAWDELRGSGKNARAFKAYLDAHGSSSYLTEYGGGQAGSSWSKASIGVKAFYQQEALDNPISDFFWHGASKTTGATEWRSVRQRLGQRADATLMIQHAMTHELLTRTDVGVRVGDKLRVFRTENAGVMSNAGVRPHPTKRQKLKRGLLESGSLQRPVRAVAGAELTIQEVPLHRVFGSYILNRPSGGSMYLGDDENEVTVLFDESIDFIYPGAWNR